MSEQTSERKKNQPELPLPVRDRCEKTSETADGRPRLTLRECLQRGVRYLESRGISDARTDAWLLLEKAGGISLTIFLAEPDRRMSEEEREQYEEWIRKRGAHIPLQYLTGEQEFMGLSFLVDQRVLIPRQDTELLAEEALRRMTPGCRVLDLCTGSGCLAISLAKLDPGRSAGTAASVTASDLSADALAVAAENARRLKADVTLVQSNLFEALAGPFDLIVSNPPYIRTGVMETLAPEVREHEPRLALDGGGDGLRFYREIIAKSRDYLTPGGYLLLEIGYDQKEQVSALLHGADYEQVAVFQDLSGHDRVAAGRRSRTVSGASGRHSG